MSPFLSLGDRLDARFKADKGRFIRSEFTEKVTQPQELSIRQGHGWLAASGRMFQGGKEGR